VRYSFLITYSTVQLKEDTGEQEHGTRRTLKMALK
jgi:hypothetical protein